MGQLSIHYFPSSYGDIAPVGLPGRIFAIFWSLSGLIIIGIFTGVIATSLTVVSMETNVKLYGAKVSYAFKDHVRLVLD